ncbi:hypothetical protein TNCV_4227171 [Trichonephila clavipes]|nr:hypothetical protein TNCV_4227171 [Trichonephila clavipes]
MAQKRKLDYYDDDFDFDTESDEDFIAEDDTSDEENFSSVRRCFRFNWVKGDKRFATTSSNEARFSKAVQQLPIQTIMQRRQVPRFQRRKSKYDEDISFGFVDSNGSPLCMV